MKNTKDEAPAFGTGVQKYLISRFYLCMKMLIEKW